MTETVSRVVRVMPDVPAIDKTFDYLVPEKFGDQVRVGAMVRIELQGRRVGGWIVADDVVPPVGVKLKGLAKVSGWGPSEDVIDLASWAAWRWAGRPASLLRTASPDRTVLSLPPRRSGSAPRADVLEVDDDLLVVDAFAHERRVVRWSPTSDVYPLALAAARLGNALILAPSLAQASDLGHRMRRAGVNVAIMPGDWARARAGAVVIGSRASAWAPMRDLAVALVIDEHDEVYREERTPTWHARDVVIERAARAGVPCVLVSPTPTLEALAWSRGVVVASSRSGERDSWPILDVIDRRSEDTGRSGLYSKQLVNALRSGRRVVCVLNRKGRSRLLVCAMCGEVARCENCDASVAQGETGILGCRRCLIERPMVCSFCGATKLKNVRAGVTRVREELEALANTTVVEVTGRSADSTLPESLVYVGTEAVLHQVAEAQVVAFLDFDQELLAPRYRAAEQALSLLVRAARLVGGRRGGGRVLVQTRIPDHEVVQAALHGDPARVSAIERERRELLRFPPVSALATVSGASAEAYMGAFGSPMGIEVLGPSDGMWVLRAPDHRTLCDALAATPRPSGRLRVEVDPLRI